jgi:Lar family restriction alleviation protein
MANSKNIDLKPCPHCGSIDITLYSVDSHIDDNGVWKLVCESCPASMSVPYLLGNYCKGDKPQMLKEIIKEWNKRKHEIHRKRSNSSSRKKAGLTKGSIQAR